MISTTNASRNSGQDATDQIETTRPRGILRKRFQNAPDVDKKILDEYLSLYERINEWESQYDDLDQETIDDYLIYFTNQYDGKPDLNESWEDITDYDPTGKLCKEAERMLPFVLRLNEIGRIHPALKYYEYIEHKE